MAQRLPLISNLYRQEKLKWLGFVWPLWLPSTILFVGSLVILLVSNHRSRRRVAYFVLATALALAALMWAAYAYPSISLFALLRSIDPWWLPALTLVVIGTILWLLPYEKPLKIQAVGSCLIVAGLVLAVILCFVRAYKTASLGGFLREISPWWLPVLALLVVCIILWLPLSRKYTRWSGYLSLVLSLAIGTVVYFNAGELGDVRLGPIPAGTPVNLLANFNSEAERETQIRSVQAVAAGLAEIESRSLDDSEALRVMKEKIAPALMKVNKCPDFVMDHGHYFPWFKDMTDDDKEALIELLKTF